MKGARKQRGGDSILDNPFESRGQIDVAVSRLILPSSFEVEPSPCVWLVHPLCRCLAVRVLKDMRAEVQVCIEHSRQYQL